MPFLEAVNKCVASSHLWSGICDRSYNVPTRTVNFSRHPEQKYQPGPIDLPPNGFTHSPELQNGQTGPLGQRDASRNFRAASSSLKAGWLRSKSLSSLSASMKNPVFDTRNMAYGACSVKYINALDHRCQKSQDRPQGACGIGLKQSRGSKGACSLRWLC